MRWHRTASFGLAHTGQIAMARTSRKSRPNKTRSGISDASSRIVSSMQTGQGGDASLGGISCCSPLAQSEQDHPSPWIVPHLPRFWLHTNTRTGRITVHRDGCAVASVRLRHYRARRAGVWTGPVSWDELALLPVESYHLCSCWQGHCSAYGPRRKRSRRARAVSG
jgi:hypothetical protein